MNRFTRKERRLDQLKVPDAVRIRLGGLFNAQKEAIAKLPEVAAWQHAMAVAVEFLGLDPAGQHSIDFATGIVTPAPGPAKPTLVKDEAAS